MPDRHQFELTPAGVWVVDAWYRTEYLNSRMAGMLACTSQMRGIPILDCVLDEARDEARRLLERKAGTADLPFRREDGSVLWALVSISPLPADADDSASLACVAIDITARRLREDEAARCEAYYRAIVDTAADQIFVIDLADRIEYVNRSAAAQFRTMPEQLIGRPRSAVFPPEIASQQRNSLDRVLSTGESLYVESPAHYLKGPVWLSTWLAPVRAADGRVTGVLGYSRDITERKRSEELVRATNERLNAVLSHAPIVLWAVDGDGVVTFCAGQVLRTLGIAAEDIIERAVADLKEGPFPFVRDGIQRALAGASSTCQVTTGGLEFEAWCAPLDGAGARERGAISVLVDITERRRLEADLATARKLEAVGRLAGGIAHDFNNNLTVILGFTDMLLEQIDSDKPMSRDLVEIQSAAIRAAGLVQRLLAFGRRQVIQASVLDLNQTIGGLRQMLERLVGERIELTLTLAPDVTAMVADAGQLEQVIMNLVLNARDAMPKGGRLDIRTMNVTLPYGDPDAPPGAPSGPYVKMAVSDTGVGMDAYTRARLFEPFFTTKPVGEGTGLGLATVYAIVKQLSGFIWVASDLGQGSTFNVCWPAAGDGVEPVRPPALPRTAPFVSRQTILLVEDEETVRRFASTALERHGFRVLQAGTSERALELASQPGGAQISLLLTDVVMPGMTGTELARAFRQLRPNAAVLLMSGYPASVVAGEAGFEPLDRLLSKPFTAGDLLARVREALEGR